MTQNQQNKPMEAFINGFMEKYRMKDAKCSSQDSAFQFVTKEAVELIRQTGIVNEDEYEIHGRCAQGNWAHCPYVDIMYKEFKKKGVCIAYILNYNCNEVYLTLNQIVNDAGKKQLRKKVKEVLAVLGAGVGDFSKGNEGVELGSTQQNPKNYKEATILYKKYEKDRIPEESVLCDDLRSLMGLYHRWIVSEGDKTLSPIGGGDMDPAEESERADSTNKSQENGEAYDTNKEIAEEIKSKGFLHQNVIFYGVPGCGKSYKINELLHLKDDKRNPMDGKYYKRILFHPEYSYSDFVGQIRPVTEGGNITYKFVPGPFTEILKDAYLDQEHEYFLIIEEINRGNAPAIFGDLFQLLDRDTNGKSEYSIYNKDILDCLNKELVNAEKSTVQSIEIPANLAIFATMNTCDQNVFTLDTAFKRRWRMSRIENKFDAEQDKWIIQCGDVKFSWKKFAEAVNDAILNYCNDGTAAEDKRLGAYFVKENDTKDAKRFAEKVMMYLWDDVAKYDRSQLFDNKYRTLDEVIEGFAAGRNVFSPNCEKLKALYEEKDDPLAETGAEAAEEAEKPKNPETDSDVPDEQAEA